MPESDDRMIDYYLFRLTTLLLSAMAARAANGKESAAAYLDKAIREALDDHRTLLMRENPVIVQRVQDSPQMPGWVSTHKPLMDDEIGFAKKNEQGRNYPFKPPESRGGKKTSILTAQNFLVDRLYKFMVDSRYDYVSDAEFFEDEFGKMHPMTKRLRALPFPISSTNWREWCDLGVEILSDATGGNPKGHPMFKKKVQPFEKGGPFAAMNSGKFWELFEEAFKKKAKAVDSVNERPRVE
jgi:hypothetical protein